MKSKNRLRKAVACTISGILSFSCMISVSTITPVFAEDESTDEVRVTGIDIDDNYIYSPYQVSQEIYPYVHIYPENASNWGYSLTSSDPNVLEITNNTGFTAKNPGTATITATSDDGNFTDTCEITVIDQVHVSSINFYEDEVEMQVGQQISVGVDVEPYDALNRNYTMTSSDPSVAEVNENNEIKAVSAGTAVITATTEDGGLTAELTVTVKEPVALEGISFENDTTEIQVGQTEWLTMNFEPADAFNQNYTLTSSNPDVAAIEVNPHCVVGKAEGTAVITATSEEGNYTAKCTVTVVSKKDVTGISFSESEIEMQVDQTNYPSINFEPEDALNKQYTLTSSDPTVVEITDGGGVSALKEGTAVITATSEEGGYTAKCTVTVVSKKHVTGISFSESEIEMQVSEVNYPFIIFEPQDALDKSYKLSSSDSTVVKILENGNIKALKEGSAVITATSNDGGYTDQLKVTVTKKVDVTGIIFPNEQINCQVGDTLYPECNILPDNASNRSYTLTSSNPDVVAADEYGGLQAVSTGTAIITATSTEGNFTAQCKVVVIDPIEITDFSFQYDKVTLSKGESKMLAVTILPAVAQNSGFTLTSSNPDIVAVSSEYSLNVVGVSAGTATVTAKTADGKHTAECTVTVEEAEDISGIHFVNSNVEMYEDGYLSPIVKLEPSEERTYDVSLKSSDENVVSVVSNTSYPLLHAVGEGTAVITASAENGKYTAQCKVEVKTRPDLDAIAFMCDSLEINKNEIAYMKIQNEPSGAIHNALKFTSSDSGIVEICDEDRDSGEWVTVKGVSTGTAVITAETSDGKIKAQCTVYVEEGDTEQGQDKVISFENSSEEIPLGQTISINVNSTSTDYPVYQCRISSSNPAVVYASQYGLEVTGITEGTATLTVRTPDGKYSDTCNVTVTKRKAVNKITMPSAKTVVLSGIRYRIY